MSGGVPLSSNNVESTQVLVVEDDDTIGVPLLEGLAREGFAATWVRTGAEALGAVDATDFVLLDLGLPDLDGGEVCRRIRARTDVPIIVVTARGDELDRVRLLEIGADDYVALLSARPPSPIWAGSVSNGNLGGIRRSIRDDSRPDRPMGPFPPRSLHAPTQATECASNRESVEFGFGAASHQ
jgi:CheY-like chemotaxis protein